ncbi:ApaG [Pseudobdellovibrio exovorus JSS]|uniref:Protein ApaG n=2 Tax=Pseudobdellovibrio exovorus TaxID=453816 RepID=M4VAV5_9BACT|nr:ApaG [Pseudobdellovibrio exovorus JSS]
MRRLPKMSLKKALNTEFQITTTTAYVESESAPDQHRFFFAYKITIKNVGSSTAQLMSRHWIITDALGHIEEVRGPGVVGLQPKITAGQSFEYDSACPLKTSSGSMRGFYHFVDEDGESFEVEIPEFYLIAPTAIH